MEDRLFDPTPTLSVSEVLSRARVVIERAFGDETWVEGEIQALRRTDTHVYFDLVEGRDDGRPSVRLPVVLFEQNRRGVNALLRRAGGKLRMDDGLQVRIRGSVTAYERTGQVQLRMTAIDPNHTMGLLAAERDRVMEALAEEGLLAANGRRPLVGPPLRVTVLTSRASAAAEDFLHELGRQRPGLRRDPGRRPGAGPGGRAHDRGRARGRRPHRPPTSWPWSAAAGPAPTWPRSTARPSPGPSPPSPCR